MSRNIFSNLIKTIINTILACVCIPSLVVFLSFILIDKELHKISLLLIVICIFIWVISIVFINILNKYSKNKIVIYENKIEYKGKQIYKDSLSVKYFKFHISFLEPDLVFPKVHINSNGTSLTCYLSKKDVNKMKKLDYNIRII